MITEGTLLHEYLVPGLVQSLLDDWVPWAGAMVFQNVRNLG